MEEAGNKYHDDKGHFTDKANDGKECLHSFLHLDESNADKIIELRKEIATMRKARMAEYKIKEKYDEISELLKKQDSYYIDKNGVKNKFYMDFTQNGEKFYKKELYSQSYSDINQLKNFFEQQVQKREMIKGYINTIEKNFSHLKNDYPETYNEEFQSAIDEALARPDDKYKIRNLKQKMNKGRIEVGNSIMLPYEDKQIKAYPVYFSDGKKIYETDGYISYNVTTNEDRKKYFEWLKEDEKRKKEIEEREKQQELEKQKRKEFRKNMLSNTHSFREKALTNKLSKEELEAIDDENITQGTYVGGYSGYSRSRSAEQSEEQGSKPMSHWKKEDILDYLTSSEDLRPFEQDFRKMKTDKLKDLVLYNDGWHHTSKYFNRTPFYGIKSPRDIIKGLAYEHNAFERGLKKGFEEK